MSRSIEVIDWTLQETSDRVPPHDHISIINCVLSTLFLLLQQLQSIDENTNNGWVPNRVKHVHNDDEHYLTLSSRQKVNQSEGEDRVVPANEILEPEMIFFLLGLGLSMRNHLCKVDSKLESPHIYGIDPELILLKDPPDEAREDVGVKNNHNKPKKNDHFSFCLSVHIWLFDLHLDLFDSKSLQESAHICQVNEHLTRYPKPLDSYIPELDWRDEIE